MAGKVRKLHLERDDSQNEEFEGLNGVHQKLINECNGSSLNGSVELIPQYEDLGPRLIRIRMNDQIRELQTALRDE